VIYIAPKSRRESGRIGDGCEWSWDHSKLLRGSEVDWGSLTAYDTIKYLWWHMCDNLTAYGWRLESYRIRHILPFTVRCTIVQQSAVLRLHVVRPSVCLWRWWIRTT